MSARGWTDDAADLPLRYTFNYQFGAYSARAPTYILMSKSVQTKMEPILLPQGDKSSEYKIVRFASNFFRLSRRTFFFIFFFRDNVE